MELKFVLESILFSAQHPMSPKELREVLVSAAEQSEDATVKVLKKTALEAIDTALEQLVQEHAQAQRSYRLACVAGAWQFVSQPEYAPWIKALVGHKARPPRLSQPALETLAIIAYRQPITRAEIEQVRGVTVDGVMQTLIERNLVEGIGRADAPGRPVTYGTTQLFLEYFGISNLEDLPAADELRRIPVTKPEGLLTIDPGLATAPPEQLMLGQRPAATDTPDGSREPAPTSPEAQAPPETASSAASETQADQPARSGRRSAAKMEVSEPSAAQSEAHSEASQTAEPPASNANSSEGTTPAAAPGDTPAPAAEPSPTPPPRAARRGRPRQPDSESP